MDDNNNNEMDNNNNNNEMHNNKEIDKSGSPSPLSLAFSLVNYRWWISITRKSTLIKKNLTLVTLVPRWVIERRLWPETPPHSSCPLSSRWSGTCPGRPESRLLNIFFPASQPSDPRILPRKKKQGEGNYKSFDLSQIADETFSAFTNSFFWWSVAGRGSLLILWEDAGSSIIYSGPYYFYQQYFFSSSIWLKSPSYTW